MGIRVAVNTVLRAYEYAHRREIRARAGIDKGMRKVRLGDEKFAHFESLYDQGIRNGAELARQVGCSRNTSLRWKRRIEQERESAGVDNHDESSAPV